MDGTRREKFEEVAAALIEVTTAMVRCLTDRQDLSLTTASTLARLDRDGPLRLTVLAAAEGVTQPSMTQLVQRLEREGLVARVRDPDDARVCLVAGTEEGRRLLAERKRAACVRVTDLLAALSPSDREALGSAMRTALPIVRRMFPDVRRARVPDNGTAP